MVTVVFTGGEAPPSALCLAWLDSAQNVIAADGGLRLLRGLGRRADLWIGDGDSLPGGVNVWKDWYLEAKLLDCDKDDSDTEAAVREAGSLGEVWLVGGSGGRMDHWMANLRLAAQNPQVTRWLTGHEAARTLGPGQSLTLAAGTVSVFPLGAGPWKIRSKGLKWPLDAVDFGTWHSLSNFAERSAEITVEAGRVLVMQPFPEEPAA